MSRKNNRHKRAKILKDTIEKVRKDTDKYEEKMKKRMADNLEEAKKEVENGDNDWEDVSDENEMKIEPEKNGKIKKIKKNKMFQHRIIKIEKKRLRKQRIAPILVNHDEEMNVEE